MSCGVLREGYDTISSNDDGARSTKNCKLQTFINVFSICYHNTSKVITSTNTEYEYLPRSQQDIQGLPKGRADVRRMAGTKHLHILMCRPDYDQMLPGTNHSRAIARSGVDWICVDCEHGNIDGSTPS
jgi:hypothetical protein